MTATIYIPLAVWGSAMDIAAQLARVEWHVTREKRNGVACLVARLC